MRMCNNNILPRAKRDSYSGGPSPRLDHIEVLDERNVSVRCSFGTENAHFAESTHLEIVG